MRITFQLIELIIAKHRNGPVGTVTLKFDEKNKIL
jgi:replicative DNA helicase